MNLYREFLAVRQPITELKEFQRYMDKWMALKQQWTPDTLWMVPQESTSATAVSPVKCSGGGGAYMTSPLFKDDERWVIDTCWNHATELQQEMSVQKPAAYDEFVGGLQLDACEKTSDSITFFPKHTIHHAMLFQVVEAWLKDCTPEKKTALEPLANTAQSTKADHAAFSFASYEISNRRRDALTVIHKLAQLSHTCAAMVVQWLDWGMDEDFALPDTGFLNRIAAAKRSIVAIHTIIGQEPNDCDDLVSNNSVAPPETPEVDIGIVNMLRPYVRSIPSNIQCAATICDALVACAQSSIDKYIHEAINAFNIPNHYEAFCFFKATRNHDAIQEMLIENQDCVDAVNHQKERLAERLRHIQMLSIGSIDVAALVTKCHRVDAQANLWLSALGMLNYLFIKKSVKSARLLAGKQMVEDLHMWKYPKGTLEDSRISALSGISDVHLPLAFQDEIMERVAELESLESQSIA